jgi:ABC-type Fe3+/spermidine/putrescine transport system ATPase subunit
MMTADTWGQSEPPGDIGEVSPASEIRASIADRPIVELRNTTKRYGNTIAVSSFSLKVRRGEFFTLLGASGSGKTTTLLVIAGFESPDVGSVWLSGQNVTKLQPQERNIGIVFQSYALFPHMNVNKNVAFPLRMHRVPKKEIDEQVKDALALVRLQGMGNRRPAHLSGGQQQRVALARALVFNPTLLLMDEPLGSLDKQLRTEMQREIKHVQSRTNATVIYVTHDQEEALSMSDRIGVMAGGELKQVGTPEELFKRPRSRLVGTVVGDLNVLPTELLALRTDGRATVRLPSGSVVDVPAVGERGSEDAWLCARPQYVRICPVEEGVLEGQVKQVQYVGGMFRLFMELRGQESEVRAVVDAGSRVPRVGEAVGLELDPDNCALVYE